MNVQKKGLFCVVEGMDGAGKTTALETLLQWIEGRTPIPQLTDAARSALQAIRQFDVVFLREPTTLATGQEIRRRLSSDEETDSSEWIQLFRADREANLRLFVEPAIEQGRLVVQDRYLYSTAAYQGAFAADGPMAVLKEFSDFRRPDLLIFLSIDESTAFSRMDQRQGVTEVFERRDRWLRIQQAYLAVLPDDAVLIDAARPLDIVVADMARAIAQIIHSER